MIGATADDWAHWEIILGLGANLLPVVPDPQALPSEYSKVKKFGKIPSMYDGEGRAYGLPNWTTLSVNAGNLAHWSADRRYSMCLRLGQSSGVYALDIDVEDYDIGEDVAGLIGAAGLADPLRLPRRYRDGSLKHLYLFRYHETLRKSIIDWGRVDTAGKPERIEILGEGQQCVVAGSHPSGVPYLWDCGGPGPADIPHLDSVEFRHLLDSLNKRFGTSASATSVTPAPSATDAGVLSEITPSERADLIDALNYAPLVEHARDNSNWSEIGYALLSLGVEGYELWSNFSERAPNQGEPDAAQAWWEAHERQTPRSDFRHVYSIARSLGWRSVGDPARFSAVDGAGAEGRVGSVDAVPGPVVAQETDTTVPIAQDLCTDLANARRIQAHFGSKLRSIAGTFYVYDGRRWVKNDAEANRCAARLSAIIKEEANEVYAKFEELAKDTPDLAEAYQSHPRRDHSPARRELARTAPGKRLMAALDLAERLRKWLKTSEDATRQTAALGLVRKMLTEETARLDTKHHLLNVMNGTIDLRTGVLHAHDPNDWITQLAPTYYYPEAVCPRFRKFLVEVLDDERAAFLQRWFGYCCTGETREQKVVLHIGPGGNGKGTLFRLLNDVLGGYVHTAAQNLLTGSGSERHPTEIADLFGRRFVVAHESDDGAILREGILKQASGEDELSGRFMFKDFFKFTPTFKLQLLTNHKPIVKGQDFGIWRRLLLVNYDIKYGTEAQVKSGEADRVGDETLTQTLMDEREGILTWLVQGARDWYNFKLRPPTQVYDASMAYRNEQDRVRQFVEERCILDRAAWSSFNGPFGLYPAYVHWCKDSGFYALTVTRFIGELQRVVPGFRREAKKSKHDGVSKTYKGCCGVRVNVDQDGGGVADESLEGIL